VGRCDIGGREKKKGPKRKRGSEGCTLLLATRRGNAKGNSEEKKDTNPISLQKKKEKVRFLPIESRSRLDIQDYSRGKVRRFVESSPGRVSRRSFGLIENGSPLGLRSNFLSEELGENTTLHQRK